MTEENQGEVHGERIKSFVQRVERLNSEAQATAEDIKDVYSEVKSTGLDAKIIRKIVALRKIELNKRREEEELLDLYMCSMGAE